MKPLPPSPLPPLRGRESGHLILAVMIGLTVAAILLTAVAQQWSVVERREKEEELIFRGNEYVRAIKKYQSEHGGAYPTSLETLAEPGPRRYRYIRKLYRDPLAPDGKWGILLADPGGKGFINPNAIPKEGEGGIPGLEDLGKGLRDSFNQKLAGANNTNDLRKSIFEKRTGLFEEPDKDREGKPSVTAPGQPTGPIVGVVSLFDHESFRRYRDTENYTEWTFSVFDLQNQQQGQQAVAPVPTPGSGIGPGGAQTILGGRDGAVGGNTPRPFGNLPPGAFGKPVRPQPPPTNKPPN